MNPQLQSLLVAYAVSAAGIVVGLLIMRAGSRAWWRLPVYSAMAMGLAVMSWSLVRKHLLPPEWGVTRARTLYYCALVLYAVTGIALGLLLGKLTQRKTPESEAGRAHD
jgi:uncharacterized membrane-anchored protein YhcB (DUF1043 family)